MVVRTWQNFVSFPILVVSTIIFRAGPDWVKPPPNWQFLRIGCKQIHELTLYDKPGILPPAVNLDSLSTLSLIRVRGNVVKAFLSRINPISLKSIRIDQVWCARQAERLLAAATGLQELTLYCTNVEMDRVIRVWKARGRPSLRRLETSINRHVTMADLGKLDIEELVIV